MSVEQEMARFKRANFFSGLLATPQFWNDIQDYHFMKEVFYNRVFHGAGIVPGLLESLKVRVLDKTGSLTLVVSPGFAIDHLGRGVFLHEPKAVMVDVKKYNLPTTIYLTLSYHETLDDYFLNSENQEQGGYRKIVETAHLEICTQLDSARGQIELCRVHLEAQDGEDVKRLYNPQSVTAPGANELDFRYVSYIIPAKKGMSPYLANYLVELLELTRNVSTVAYDALPLPSFRELQTVSLTAKMLVSCGNVNFEDVLHLMEPFFDINNQIVQEIVDYERKEDKRYFSMLSDFETIRRAVYSMGDLVKYYDYKYETLDNLLKARDTIIRGIQNLLVARRITLHDISLMSYELPRVLLVQDERYTLVDYLDLSSAQSVEEHELEFMDSKDVAASNQAFTYPDGVLVRDTVKRFVAGQAQFKAKNLIKRRKLILIRRTDILRGNYSVDVSLGDSTQSLVIDGVDSLHRWRNLSVQFHEEEVTDYSLPVRFSIGEHGRDNFGTIWIYQKL